MLNSPIVGVLLAGALTVGLSACSGDSKDPDPKPSASSSSSPGAVDPSRVSPSDLPSVPVLAQEDGGDLKDLTLGDCNTEAGEQKVDASLTSTLDSKQDFVVSLKLDHERQRRHGARVQGPPQRGSGRDARVHDQGQGRRRGRGVRPGRLLRLDEGLTGGYGASHCSL